MTRREAIALALSPLLAPLVGARPAPRYVRPVITTDGSTFELSAEYLRDAAGRRNGKSRVMIPTLDGGGLELSLEEFSEAKALADRHGRQSIPWEEWING